MDIKYLSSHVDHASLPAINAEVAFIGRSNVGKSSLINVILGKKICFTSKKPGKTVCINIFCDDYRKYGFIDLPGYGFAKTPIELQQKWTKLIPEYLINRLNLKMIFVLIDVRIGFSPLDFDAINLMLKSGRPISLVFTKIDKLNKNDLQLAKEKIIKEININHYHNLYFISNKHPIESDIPALKKKINMLLGK